MYAGYWLPNSGADILLGLELTVIQTIYIVGLFVATYCFSDDWVAEFMVDVDTDFLMEKTFCPVLRYSHY